METEEKYKLFDLSNYPTKYLSSWNDTRNLNVIIKIYIYNDDYPEQIGLNKLHNTRK